MYLWTIVLEGPIRYGLARLHLSLLAYFPTLALLGATAVFVSRHWRRPASAAFVLTILLCIAVGWGLADLPRARQALFGFWVLVPFMSALWLGGSLQWTRWRTLLATLFSVAAVGVFLNPLVHYPWSGDSLRLFGYHVTVSRQWLTGIGKSASGVNLVRYGGFSRASFDASAQLLLFGLLLVPLFERPATKLLIWITAGLGIAITTEKGWFVAWLVLSIYFSGGAALRWPKYWLQLWLGILLAVMLVMVLLPLSTLAIDLNRSSYPVLMHFPLYSFGERLSWTWPNSLRLLSRDGVWHWLVGRGLGAIGPARHYFDLYGDRAPTGNSYLYADNLFVYIAVQLGVPLAIILLGTAWMKMLSSALCGSQGRCLLALMLATMTCGIVSIESGLPMFFLGLAFSAKHSANPSRADLPYLDRLQHYPVQCIVKMTDANSRE